MQVEALKLLSQIKKHVADSKDDMGKVLLAGYGFGGFVVKQAIVLSNTIPTFYGIALDISSLVFFNTPHESTGHLTWEEFLLHMLRETNRSYRGHLSRILSELVESVSQLSHSFNTFASKYPTSDFIQGEYARIAKIDKSSEDVVVWDNESGSVDSLKRFPLGSLEKQKSLRKHFAPCHILSSLRKHRLKNEMMNMTSPEEYKRAYFGILQVLSSSRWILYEPKVLERPEEFYSLQEIYGSVVQKISFKTIRGGSLEIIGPTGSGKSAVIKLLLQSMTQKSSLTVINNFMDSSGAPSGSLYSILVSSIHQIVSQRPHLFPYIRNLMDHVTGQSTWTEPVVRAALWSLFQHSEFTDFLIIIHDFDLCPTEVKSWWLHIQSSLAMSSTSTCTFIIGSRGSCAEFPAGTQYRIDLSKTRDHNKRILVSNNVQHFFQHYYNLSPSYEAFSEDTNFKEDLQQKIIKKTGKFKGSMSSIKLYLGRLFQSFTLSSIPAIERSLSICPTTEEALYEERLLALSHESKEILNWASAVLHWIVLSVRSLRVEELAVAAALSTKHGQISDLKLEISMDVKRDLYKNLGGLVSVENEHVCLVSPLVKELWTRETHVSQDAHNNLTILCLHYLQLILDDQNSQSVKSFLYPMSQTNHSEGVEDNEMMFLHYACYFWPVHFLRAKTPSEQAKTAVAAFLLMPSRSGKWFRLYFTGTLSNGQAIPNVPAPEVTAKILDDIEEEPDSQKCAIMMASHFGLYSVIPYLSDTEESDGLSDTKESGGDSRELWVRQGCVEFKREFSNAPSTQDLEYYILNNDDIAVQTIIHSDHEALNHSFLLHKAASAGSQKVVTVLYGLLDNPMQRDQKGRTPLHVAAICGHVDIVNFFVAQNTPIDGTSEIKTPNAIDIQDKELKTCLMMAIQSGHVEISQHLAQSGSNLTLTDITGRSAIHYAVLFCPQILDILIAQNKDIIYMRDNGGQTPLHFIAQCGKSDLTEVILSAARESGRLSEVITAVDAQGMTALHHASENGYTAIAQVLTNEMDNKQEKDSLGRLAADMAAENGHLATLQAIASNNLYGGHSSLIAASRAGQLLIVEYLLQRGIDPNSSEFTDHTPLTIASAHGWTGIARALLNHGAELDLGDSERRTPLHHAAKNGMKEVALILLTYKSNVHITTTNVNAPDVLRYTPLHYASMAGDVDVMRLLLKHNADVNAHSRDQETPLHLSVHNADAVELLLDKGAEIDNVDILDQTPLLKAVKNEHQESAKLLISRQANIYMRDNDGKNVLHYAIAQDNIVIFELLHRKYNTPINNEPGNLELAVRRAALKVLKSMLDKNPDAITSTILRGRTLLGLAAGFDSLDVVTFLLDVGSDPNQTTSGARTPLHEAAASGR
ncbi:ankyrin repeat-containing domain protein [Trichoderma sp. TUCIM 5745]